MFGIFDGIQKSVSNVIDVGTGIITLGEYGDCSKETVSKLIADGVEVAIIAQLAGVGEDVIEKFLED